MRLTENQRKIILGVVAKVCEPLAVVTLFGSRAIDDAKGGDIDLLIESKHDIAEIAQVKARLTARLYIALDG